MAELIHDIEAIRSHAVTLRNTLVDLTQDRSRVCRPPLHESVCAELNQALEGFVRYESDANNRLVAGLSSAAAMAKAAVQEYELVEQEISGMTES